jgi:hypothetical protein
VLVAERLIERVRIGSAVRCVEDEMLAAPRSRFFFDRLHEQLADSAASEALADHERGYLAPQLVALDEILDVEHSETCYLPVGFGDDCKHRWVGGDAGEPFRRLLGRRRIAELAEERRNRGDVLGLRFA